MTRNGHHQVQPSTSVTPWAVYASAALQGMLANPNTLHDAERSTAAAAKYADRMVERQVEAVVSRELRR